MTTSFADLCDAVRKARHGHIRAVNAVEAAEEALKKARAEEAAATGAVESAEDALWRFIDSETEVSA